MSIFNQIVELQSDDTIEKNQYLKTKFSEILLKKEELKGIFSVINSIVDKIRDADNLDKINYDFFISLNYKNSPTPELKINFTYLSYNLINKEFNYFTNKGYDYFLNFSDFVKNVDNKINQFFEYICKLSSELCQLFHSFLKELFKIENELQILKFNTCVSYLKSFKLTKEQIDQNFIDNILHDKSLLFKIIKVDSKKLKIETQDYSTHFNTIIENIKDNCNIEENIEKLKSYLSKNIIFLHKYNDFLNSIDLHIENIYKHDSFNINRFAEYINIKNNLNHF